MANKDKYTRECDKRFTLRIEKSLFEEIKKLARVDRRPIGREIEYILDNAIKTRQLNLHLNK